MISLVAFLGNPGQEYARTRHNAAWIIADALKICSGVLWQQKFQGQYGRLPAALTNGNTVHTVKPETYMNLSGNCIGKAAQFFKIPPENILIVHDELELPPATVSLKWAGGLGGHNGLRSIKAALGTADFWRLRIGIGRPDKKQGHSQSDEQHSPAIADYVLAPFSQAEYNLLRTAIPTCDTLCSLLCTEHKDPHSLLPAWGKIKPEIH
ncbi:MAG: aminoacyl-tRNA hydrolase [Treponema sp.]